MMLKPCLPHCAVCNTDPRDQPMPVSAVDRERGVGGSRKLPAQLDQCPEPFLHISIANCGAHCCGDPTNMVCSNVRLTEEVTVLCI